MEKRSVMENLKAKPENKVCFDCGEKNNPTWASAMFGVFICDNCSHSHLDDSLNICFFRSTTDLDSWSPEQLKALALGGNNRARLFFEQHGWTNADSIWFKYVSVTAALYKLILAKDVEQQEEEEDAVKVDESDDAQKRFWEAESISSAQFFADDDLEPGTTLEMVKNGMWHIAGRIKESFAEALVGEEIYRLRRRVAELKQILHGEYADYVPIATRRDWAYNLWDQVLDSSSYHQPIYGAMLQSIKQDAETLMEQVRGMRPYPFKQHTN